MKDKLDLSIFRDYDIRGIYPQQINEKSYYFLGRAIATYIKDSPIAVGYDCRLSSQILFKALTSGILDSKIDVVNLGQISTEIHYFAAGKYQFPANLIITASHNPPQYNGLKIIKKGMIPLHGKLGLPEIKSIMKRENFIKPSLKGKIVKKNIIDEWINHALRFINLRRLRPIKVVVDAGNGMGGISWQRVKNKIPIKIIPLYFRPDGHFAHHLPDPIKEENLKDLKLTIKKEKADLGFALDGDADRLFVIDEKSNTLSGSITGAILAEALIDKYGPSIVLYNAVCSRIVPETVKRLKGKPIRVKVGHSIIKERMKKEKALFAAEHSGHFYFRDNFMAESSLIAGLIFLEYFSETRRKLSTLVKRYAKYIESREINFKIENKNELLIKLATDFKGATSIDYLDGLSVWYPSWWFNLRASKTEPYVRLNIEAKNRQILNSMQKKLERDIINLGGIKV